MDDQEFGDLLEKCLEGTATPDEERRLVDAAGLSEALQKRLSQAVTFEAALKSFRHDPEAFARKMTDLIGRRGSSALFARTMRERLEREAARTGRDTRRKRALWGRAGFPYAWVWGSAAAALFLAVLLYNLRPVGDSSAEHARAEVARVEARRREREERLVEIEREVVKLTARPEQKPDTEVEKTLQEALARMEKERLKVEAELREAREREYRAKVELARAEEARKAASREPKAAPPPPTPAPAPPVPPVQSRVAVVTVERAEGEVYVVAGAARTGAKAGRHLFAGEGLQTVGAQSLAVVKYSDGSSVELGPDTTVDQINDRQVPVPGATVAAGNKVALSRGRLTASATPQPSDRPMTVLTSQAEVVVVGPRFVTMILGDATRVEVEEGQVKFTRRVDGRSIPVKAGYFALAAKGVALVAKRLFGPSQIADGGFEKDAQGWTWMGGTPTVTTKIVHTGSKALQVDFSAATHVDELHQRTPVAAGATYQASVWAKTNGVGGKGVGLLLSWLNASDRSIHADNLGPLAGTQDWTRLSGRFTAPPGAVKVIFFMALPSVGSASGTAWLDDCEFMRVEP